MLLFLVFFAKYSVIPKLFPFKKYFLDIGPLIKPEQFSSFKIFNAISNDLLIYEFDLSEILSNTFLNLKFT